MIHEEVKHMYNILICDDEKDIVSALKIYLSADGYQIYEAYTGKEALELMRRVDIHLILMDIMMPEMDGISAMVKIRENSNVPVILLTAKSEDNDKVLGLMVGADDYITKPFSFPVLVAKAQALMRRARGLRLGASELGYANILMDTASGTVTVDGNLVNLRPKEAKILELLLREQGRTVSRDLLIERVWGTDFDGDERMIDRHIASLRKALGTASQHIRAVYGKGYRLGGST